MRGGQQEEEAACQIYQEAIQLHNEDLCPLVSKIEALVVETIQDKNRQEQTAQSSILGKLKVGLLSEYYFTDIIVSIARYF